MARKTAKRQEVSPESMALINKDNLLLIEEFLEYCESVDRSPKTVEKYRSDLHIAMNWFREHAKNKDFTDITKRDVTKFQSWCLKRDFSPSRIRSLRSAMSSLSNYIETMLDDSFPDFRNIINKIPAPALVAVREKTVLTNEQIDELINKLSERNKTQQKCLIALASASGMRISELIQARVDWFIGDKVRLSDGMYITPEIRTKGSGVLGKRLEKYVIQEIFDEHLNDWIEERNILGIESEYLFVTRSKGEYIQVKDSTINSWLSTCSKLIDEDIYAHCLRHYAATWLKRNGVDTAVIRDFMGHNDSSTTEIYIDIGKEENLKGMLDFMKDDKE